MTKLKKNKSLTSTNKKIKKEVSGDEIIFQNEKNEKATPKIIKKKFKNPHDTLIIKKKKNSSEIERKKTKKEFTGDVIKFEKEENNDGKEEMAIFKQNPNRFHDKKVKKNKKFPKVTKKEFTSDIIKFEEENEEDDNDDEGKKDEEIQVEIFKPNLNTTHHPNFNKNNRRNGNPFRNRNTKYPGKAPVNPERLEYYSRGEGINLQNFKPGIIKKKFAQKERLIDFSIEQAARAELLKPEDAGFISADEGEVTRQYSQNEIANNVDITSATKYFNLNLEHGPYRINYTRNGRYLLMGGRRGHIAAFDWFGKRLSCELNAMEEVFDVSWLHNELMFAVAQKKWVYMYDNQGVEIHCIKHLASVLRMEFLPYHFLLATSNEFGYLAWLDVSIGKLVALHPTKMGRLSIMTHNPYNAVICLGHGKGFVSMWTPNLAEPVAKLLCHKQPIQAIAIDPYGKYMATTAADRSLKIWDVRKLEGPVQNLKLRSTVSHLNFSQRGCLAAGMGNVVEIYKDVITNPSEHAYLRHSWPIGDGVFDLKFCPYEDVLGVGHTRGFTSLLIPGSGEPNFDSLEINPFETKTQRREREVKLLLDKIQPELITLDPTKLAEIDVPTLKEKIEERKKLLFLKPPNIDFTPRKKAGKRKGTVHAAKTKQIVKEQKRMEFREQVNSKEIEKELRSIAENQPKELKKKREEPDFFIKALNRFK